MSRQGPCSNNKLTGCQGIISQRGNIICDACVEIRKNITKSRRDQDVDELVQKNIELEKELTCLYQQHNEILKNTSQTELELKSQLIKIQENCDEKLSEQQLQIKLLEIKNKEAEDTSAKLLIDNNSLRDELNKKLLELKKEKNDNSKQVIYNAQMEKEKYRLSEILTKSRIDNQNLIKERETYEMTHSQLKIDNQKINLDNNRLKEANIKLLDQNEDLVKENAMLSKMNEDHIPKPTKKIQKK